MPDKTLTVATYAAGASLAAITLIYVFGPTYLLDSNPSGSTAGLPGLSSNRKKGVVGLANPANDCFINSVLQALAGLGDLRLYLIREIHRRSLDHGSVYAHAIPPEARGPKGDRWRQMDDWKLEGLQSGIVTQGLKDILDALNERPIYKKTITAAPFVRSLETAFRQRISRQQQDAQEFLQVVAERLCDEYHAGRRARNYVRQKGTPVSDIKTVGEPVGSSLVGDKLAALVLHDALEDQDSQPGASTGTTVAQPFIVDGEDRKDGQRQAEVDEEEGFPMEGKFESQIECQTCKFRPRPTESTFCTLTLNVPQVSSTTLNACFDGLFKTELIDDFKCEKCRLVHAKEVLEAELRKSTSDSFKLETVAAIEKLQRSIDTDPEEPLEGVVLPDIRYAPKRRIARHIRITRFPKILAIHLSRSIYDSHMSQKNPAKVAFPERLPLGGLLQQKKYKLLGMVTHKGSHQSGHYESFRRQNVYPPFSNPNTFQPSGVYSVSGSPASTPPTNALQQNPGERTPLASTADLLSPAVDSSSAPSGSQTPDGESALSIASSKLRRSPTPNDQSGSPSRRLAPTSAPRDKDTETSSIRSVAMSARSTLSRITSRPSSRTRSRSSTIDPPQATPNLGASSPGSEVTTSTRTTTTAPKTASSAVNTKRRKHRNDQWWRISDEKVKEATTRDVLGMQREVYLLFYEMERAVS
ncbi:cysteine proteinase [Coniochaeta ligniaria NRRL 30616]|uniref:Ubiquitin carboxyl-terminal hydrolase n=1 Tax=Coniochaeta ligniaria NRRL 30616 TaxID=1408157 RepID=A0A1J7J5J4_9PEZI|nr:cysteine proteinase [Coniochaeta ligniaria NRRL 30616]